MKQTFFIFMLTKEKKHYLKESDKQNSGIHNEEQFSNVSAGHLWKTNVNGVRCAKEL